MANFIASVDAVGILSSQTLPDGTANPYFNLNSFLVSATGNWIYCSDYPRGGRTGVQSMLVASGASPFVTDDFYVTNGFQSKRLEVLTLTSAIAMLESFGTEANCVGYAAAVQMTVTDSSNVLVPDYMPNHEIPDDPDDPDSPMSPVTWNQWKDSTHQHIVDGDVIYIPLCSFNNSRYVAGSIIASLVADAYDVILVSDIVIPSEPTE